MQLAFGPFEIVTSPVSLEAPLHKRLMGLAELGVSLGESVSGLAELGLPLGQFRCDLGPGALAGHCLRLGFEEGCRSLFNPRLKLSDDCIGGCHPVSQTSKLVIPTGQGELAACDRIAKVDDLLLPRLADAPESSHLGRLVTDGVSELGGALLPCTQSLQLHGKLLVTLIELSRLPHHDVL